jgi:putative ABC transport system substrate-binding protein
VEATAQLLGQQIQVLTAKDDIGIEAAFDTISREQVRAVVVSGDPFFTNRRDKLVGLAAQCAVPALYAWREFVEAGGLMSYGSNLTDGYRRAGAYTGQLLRGASVADLPVEQSTRFELAINLATAKALGLTIPPMLLARVDEVIE